MPSSPRWLGLVDQWRPWDSNFRKQFNERLAKTLEHVRIHGDITLLRKVIAEIADTELRRAVIRKVVTRYPLKYDLQSKCLRLKGDWRCSWKRTARFDAFTANASEWAPCIPTRNHRKATQDYLAETIQQKELAIRFRDAGDLYRYELALDAARQAMKKARRGH